jgi:predicted DCC family thiol-disulfide oxidoreductase YuxK
MLTVVFDQDCGVCTATAQWLAARDRSIRLIGNGAQSLPAGVPREETADTVFVVDEAAGLVWTRAEAIARLLCGLPGLRNLGWRLFGALLRLPLVRWLARRGYDSFARRRHRVSAALGLTACKVPPARK